MRRLSRTVVTHLRSNHLGVLVGLWILSTSLLGAARVGDVSEFRAVGMALALGYIMTLLWWFTREVLHVRPNDFSPLLSRPRSFGPMLGALILAVGVIVAVTSGVLQNGWYTVLVSTLPALLIIVRFRDQHTRRAVVVAVAVVAVLFVLGAVYRSPVRSLGSALVIGVHLIAGVALLQHTGVGAFRTINGGYSAAFRGLVQGSVMAVPPMLLNLALAEGAQIIEITDPVGDWWMPILAVQPALAEEIWARLFLTTLFVALLYPVSRERPRRALVAALVLAVVLHVLAHVPHTITDPVSVVFMSFFYGVPMVLLFVARDLEHAIGYHFVIVFVSFVVFPPF